MRTVVEERRETPVVAEADVAVIGAGTAGFVAALAAARNGARTALIERWGYAGGAAVGGLVITIPEAAGIWGIEREFHERLLARGGAICVPLPNGNNHVHLSAPDCKILGDEMLREAGVTVYYHSLCVAVVRSGAGVEAIIMENKSGRQAVCARVFVDATGDGDVAARAGVPFTLGDGRGNMEAVTTMYMVAGADKAAYMARPPVRNKLPGRTSAIAFTEVHPGEVNCWGGRVHGDGTDVRELTRMEMELRAQIREEFANMRRYFPGFAQAYISCLAEQMGVRETRHVHADYMVTRADMDSGRRFPDSIGQCWQASVPYRSLCALGMDNLLLAGRCIGAESAACGPLRIVPNCCTTGQAAGTAAALAATAHRGVVRQVDVSTIQQTLRKQGVELGI